MTRQPQPSSGALIVGASRGLGRALALELAERGVAVALVARGREALDATAADIRVSGGRVHPIPADIADKRAPYRIAAEAFEALGAIDLLVHAASTLGPVPLRPLLDLECEELEDVLAVNVVGPFRLTKIVAASMAMRRSGTIIQISSDAATEAYPTWGPYGASKAAGDLLTRTLGAELAPYGVRCLAVDPGEMNTQMHADAIPDADPETLQDPRIVARTLVRMWSDPGPVAQEGRLVARRWEVSR